MLSGAWTDLPRIRIFGVEITETRSGRKGTRGRASRAWKYERYIQLESVIRMKWYLRIDTFYFEYQVSTCWWHNRWLGRAPKKKGICQCCEGGGRGKVHGACSGKRGASLRMAGRRSSSIGCRSLIGRRTSVYVNSYDPVKVIFPLSFDHSIFASYPHRSIICAPKIRFRWQHWTFLPENTRREPLSSLPLYISRSTFL